MGKLAENKNSYDTEKWLELAELSFFRSSILAENIGISQRQLERYTKRHFGKSPQEWLNEQRMLKAKEIIPEADSVKEVAYTLGFKQVSHFCREFKGYYGVTCSEYASQLPLVEEKTG